MTPVAHPVHLLDCTLRDGSYTIDFQFTAQDTWIISSALEQAGIQYIEIGHGLGLGASRMDKGVALETDAAYCEAVAGKLKTAQWGTFFIPGIGTLDDIDMLAGFGAQFIRIGTDVERVAASEPFIARAKQHGMTVFSNFMKTYSVSPEEFVRYALMAEQMGSDVLVVVDSAGGMLPEDVARYTGLLRAQSALPLGFHGHNNLDLASANSLAALDAGASFIDTSLQGLGRSAGNTITEVFALTLKKRGVDCGDLNVNMLMDIAEKFVKPLLREDKFTGISMTSGYAQFHSSFLENILHYSETYKIDPRELIVRLTRESQTHAPDDLLTALSEQIASEKDSIASFKLSLNDRYLDQPEAILKNAYSLAVKQNKKLVYNLVHSDRPVPLSRNVQQDAHYILLNGQGPDLDLFEPILSHLRTMDNVRYLVDSHFGPLTEGWDPATVFRYDDFAVWADSVLEDLNESFPGQPVAFCGAHPVREALERCASRYQFQRVIDPAEAQVLVSFEAPAFSSLGPLPSVQVVYDAVIGTVPFQTERPVYRVNMAPALFALIRQKEAYRKLVKRRGRRIGERFNLISGGILGQQGEIVVDDFQNPKVILGVADGRGGLEQDIQPYQDVLDTAQSYITGLGL